MLLLNAHYARFSGVVVTHPLLLLMFSLIALVAPIFAERQPRAITAITVLALIAQMLCLQVVDWPRLVTVSLVGALSGVACICGFLIYANNLTKEVRQ